MAKKDLTTSEWRPDDDLDFNFDTEIGTGLPQESKSKNRSAVSQITYGLADGVKSKLTDLSFYQRTLRTILPKHYGEIADATSAVTGGVYELYDQTQKEVKPRLNRLSKSLDKLVPEDATGLKAALGKIADWTGGRDEDTGPRDDSAGEDQAVAMMMGDIFNAQQKQGKIAESREIMRDAIANKRYAASMDLTSKMQRDISIIQQYTTNVTQAYQKKSLELQLRTYMGQRTYFNKSLELLDALRRQGDAIVKNTSLPDAAKITETERVKSMGKERLISSLYGDGGIWKKGFDNLKSSAQQFVSGITMRMDMAEMGIDMAAMGAEQLKQMNEMMAEMGLPPMTKSQLAGAAASGWAIDEATNWASPKLKEFIGKHPEFTEKLSKYARFAVNPQGKIANLRKSDDWQRKMSGDDVSAKVYKFLDYVIEQFQDSARSGSYKTGFTTDELSEGKGFDNKAHVSLTAVIPGYLAMIQRDLSIIQTGKDQPYVRYDLTSGRFKTDRAIAQQLKATLGDVAKRSGFAYKVDSAVDTLVGEGTEVSETDREIVRAFISKLSRSSNIEYDYKYIKETEVYQDLTAESQLVIDKFFEAMEGGPDTESKKTDFAKKMSGVRESTPSYREALSEMVKLGYGDILHREGLLDRTDDGYADDADVLFDFTEKHSRYTKSDMYSKTNIKAVSPDDLLKNGSKDIYNGMRKTPLYNWKYKKGQGDRAPHSGPMAQDVQKNLGNKSAPGGKVIDLQTMNGNFFAAIQYLGDKFDNIVKRFKIKDLDETEAKGKKKGKRDPLSNIDKNVEKIAAMIAAGGGVGGGGGQYREGFSLDYFLDKGIDGGKWVGGKAKDGASYVGGKIADLWKDNKDALKEKAITLFNKGADLAGTVFDAGKKFISDTIPSWVKSAKNFGKKVIDAIGEQFQTYKDLYLPNGVEPVIRAAKLTAGEYYDELSGQVILSVEQLAEVKGNIVDKAGNIIVSAQELSVGLYDRYGEKARSTAGKVAAFAASGLKWVGQRVGQAANKIKDLVMGGASKIKEWWDSSPDFSFPDFGVSLCDKKMLAELVNIRDILLGDTRNVRKRLKKAADKKAGGGGSATDGNDTGGAGGIIGDAKAAAADLHQRYMGKDSFLGKLFGKGKGIGGGFLGLATRGNDFTGPLSREEVEAAHKLDELKAKGKAAFDKVKGISQDALDRARGQQEAGDFVGPQQSTGSKLRGWWTDRKEAAADLKAQRALRDADIQGQKGSKVKSLWRNTKDSFGGLKGKIGGFKMGGRFGAIANLASGLLSGSGESEPSPGAAVDGVDGKSDQEKEVDAHAKADANAAKKSNRRGKVAQGDRAAGDNDGDGVKDGSVEDARNKQEELKAQRDKGMLDADTSAKYKSPENVLDTIGKKASSLLSGLGSGLGKVFDLAGLLFQGGKSVASGIFTGVKALGKGALALNAATGGTGAGIGAVARGLWFGAKVYAGAAAVSTAAAASTAAAVGSLALTAATAVAGTVISALLSPVVLVPAAIAGTAYLLYNLYQYANRDNASDIERLRLRQYGYGYNSSVDKFNHHVYMLEAYLEDGKVTYDSNGKPSILPKKVNIKEILSIFDMDEKDKEGAVRLGNWFEKRFKPVFFAHRAAMMKVNPKKKLGDVNSLSDEEKLKYLEITKFRNGPYDVEDSPYGEKMVLDTNKEEFLQSYDNLILKLTQEVEKKAKKDKGIAKPDPVQKNADASKPPEQKIDAAKEAAANAAANAGIVGDKVLGEGDGGKAASTGDTDRRSSGSAGPIPMAGGPLADGSGGMQFIKLVNNSRLDGLTPSLLRQFLAMAQEYGTATGKSILVTSGSRTYQEQMALWKKDPSKAAEPGKSLHEFGLALDIDPGVAAELERLGLMRKYGFTRPIGQEPWHIEPAGIQKSIDLARSNSQQRDMMIEASAGRGGGGYGTLSNSVKGKRNHELAMNLLGVESKLIQAKSEKAGDEYKKTVAMNEAEAIKSTTPSVKPSFASSDPKFSKTKDLAAMPKSQVSALSGGSEVLPDTEESGKTSTSSSTGSAEKSDIHSTIEDAAKRVGVDPELVKSVIAVESGFDPNARSRNSSAMGMGQFMPDTWNEMVSRYGRKYGIPPNASPFNVEYSALMTAEYLKNNSRVIAGVKPNPNAADLYITHLLGPSGARKFFQASPDQPVDMVVGEERARSNASLFYANGRPLTVREAYERIKERVRSKAQAFGLKPNMSGPGLKPPRDGESEVGVKLPSSGGVQPNLSGPETKTTAPSQATPSSGRGFVMDNRSAGFVSQSNQSGQRNDTAAVGTAKLEALMATSNETAQASLGHLKTIAESLSEERFAKIVSAIIAAVPKQDAKEEVKKKDDAAMRRTSQANGSSIDFLRRTSG